MYWDILAFKKSIKVYICCILADQLKRAVPVERTCKKGRGIASPPHIQVLTFQAFIRCDPQQVLRHFCYHVCLNFAKLWDEGF